ncbi:peptidase inhibitor family I36 protein [Actinoplanes sp. NBRC 101535]|uniref:peptidase inhibitor family I36 protein n=1 Tax=Actinoplanes sp. NBRC 101535 TaxID=3032196 RepID=UPI00249FB62D|nr:peptidase inhibitor family I36 protein [Actinoplanes sp. NBRC 101535]GLY06695.1 hypothetical protein Acsp01_70740 [Actinoplanes sp. NBRC 101535]
MEIRKMAAVAAASVVAAGAGLLVGATPAQASVAQCTAAYTGYLCQWDEVNYTGTFRIALPPSDSRCWTTSTYPRAAKNLTTKRVRYYSNSNCTGGYATLDPGVQVYELGFNSNSIRTLS